MSWDIDLEIDTGAGEKASVYSDNHTSNMIGIWNRAWGSDFGDAIHGASAQELAPKLSVMLSVLRDHDRSAEFHLLEPGNKWGTLETATAFVEGLYQACLRHPKCIVSLSR